MCKIKEIMKLYVTVKKFTMMYIMEHQQSRSFIQWMYNAEHQQSSSFTDVLY